MQETMDIVLELLENCGVETVNHQNSDDETSLHYAALFPSSFSEALIKLLFKYGVDASITNNENKTAEQVASDEKFEYIRFLIMWVYFSEFIFWQKFKS